MAHGPRSFGARLKALREAAGFTQDELATIAGLSVHAISALERGERRRPHVDTVRALSAALELTPVERDALVATARGRAPAFETDDIDASPLPLPPTPMLGRESELQRLRHWLADDSARLITIVGPGGVGKTRLAIAVAQELAQQEFLRVMFVPLAPLRDEAFVAAAIAEAFGLADTAADALPDRLRVVCHNVPTWLVLDNFEHLLDAAPLVAVLLAAVPSLRILVTSRAPLHLRGEREFALNPLDCGSDADDATPSELAQAPAVRLFLDRIRDVVPDFRLTAANAAPVRAICVRLDGLPLALELASRWMKVLPVDELLERLKRPHDLAPVAPLDAPERQRTMTATVAWSVQLLAAEEQRALRRFGALPGRFSIDAAASVLQGEQDVGGNDDAIRLVAALLDKSLILRADTSALPSRPVYYMLETVRAYALNALHLANEYDEATAGLARYCRNEAAQALTGLIGPRQVEWLDRVREDLESYRVTLAWLIARGDAANAASIAWPLLMFLVIRGHATEGRRWYETLLEQPLSAAAETQCLIGAGTLQYLHGDLPRARDTLLRAIGNARDYDLPALHAHAAMIFGHVEYSLGNFDNAQTVFAVSAHRFEGHADQWVVGNALGGLAWVALAIGNSVEARQRIDEAATALKPLGPWFRALGNYLSALLAVQAGEANQALAAVRESLTLLRETHDRFGVIYAFAPLAGAASLLQEDGWVARIVGASDALTERSGIRSVDPMGQKLWDRARLDAHARLGPARWARAYDAGRRSSIDVLLKEINQAFEQSG